MSFDNWRARLAGKTIKTFLQPQLEDEGYYRKPITEPVLGANGKTNGQKRIIGWEPVAYFIDEGMLRGVIGDRDMAANEVTDEGLWSWVVKYPISEELFRAVSERGEKWPDLPKTFAGIPVDDAEAKEMGLVPASNREVTSTDNKPPVVEPHIEHGEAIDNAVRAAQDLKITDAASAAIAMGAQNRLAELRIAADKAGHALYDPLHAAYKKEQARWPGMVKKAKDQEDALQKLYLTWREAEKQKAAKALAEQVEAQRLIDEANARAADRAIAAGVPEEAPFVVEMPEPIVMPAPVSPTYRASGQRTAPKEVERWHFDGIEDFAAAYEFFKDNEAVKTTLRLLAAMAIKNGQEVPGTRRHFGLI